MILRNGQPFNIDSPFVLEDGTQFPANWYRLATSEERERFGFTEVPDPEPKDDRFYSYNSVERTWTEKPLDACKEALKFSLSGVRWSKETAGIVYSNSVFATDEQSKVNYLAAVMQAQANSNYTVSWKVKTIQNTPTNVVSSKFVDLSSADVITVTNAGIDYISKCFENEKIIVSNIDKAKTLKALLDIDIEAGWPSREY